MPKLIYGIGYFDTPPFSRTEAYNGFSGKNSIINFYRNGELLWNEECEPETSVVLPKANDEASPYYDLMGRPVANPTRGIYIKDGRKVILK
jgi:hypothetical protein